MDTLPLILPAAPVVASVLLRSPTVTVTSLIPAFVNAVSIFSCISCFVVTFVAVQPASVSSTIFLAAATLTESVIGSLSIVLSIGTLSETLPFVMDTFPLILPAASVVASVLLRSPTVTVTSLIPAFVNAVSIFSCISCFVVPFVAVQPVSVSSTIFLAASTFAASVIGSLSIVLSIATLSETLPFVMDTFPLILPAAPVVASVLLRSPTVTVTSLIPAFVNAVSIFSCISCFVVPFVAV